MLAKATCSFNRATFFNCSAASLISKFRGDSEKIVRCLFQAARLAAPSIVFLDEIDALTGSRNGDSEHEASRRMKTELFAQIDGLTSKLEGKNVSTV
jgi:katanin p60 ATPase-containing subunit A1